MEKANVLSRRLDKKVGVKKDNENQKLIQREWIHSLVKVVIERSEIDILEKTKIVRKKNKEIVKIVKLRYWEVINSR